MKLKKVHILLSKKSWDELHELREKVKFPYEIFDKGHVPDKKRKKEAESYEEYLKQEEEDPTYAYLG